MNWKKILTINLTPVGKSNEAFRKKEDTILFPNLGRIGRFLTGRSASASRGFELGEGNFEPGRNYRSLGKNWRGPIYFSAKSHRSDLQYIIGQIKSFVRGNVPLASGLESVAREEQRRSRFLGATYALKNALGFTAMLLLAMLVAAILSGSAEIAAFAAVPLMLTFFFLASAVRTWLQDRKGLTLANLIAMMVSVGVFAQFVFMLEMRLNRGLVRSYLYAEPEDIALVALIAVAALCFVLTYRIARQGGPREMVLVRLRDLLESGHDLSEAMRRLPRFFPRFYADMVEAGEETGRMDDCLAELCEDVGTDMKVQRQIRGTLLYLGIVGFVQVFLMTFLMIKVVPVFFEITNEFGYTAHVPFIGLLVDFGDVVYEGGKIGILTAVAVAVVILFPWRILRKRRRNFSARSLSSLFLLLPGFRGMVMQDNFTVITGTLEKLLCAGIPLDTAVEKAIGGDVNPVYARLLRRVHRHILEGESLIAAFQQSSSGIMVPASFTSLVAVGEQSGMLPEALAYLHTFYRTQANIRARILVDVIKPFGIMAMGLVVMLFMRDMFSLLVGVTESVLNTL